MKWNQEMKSIVLTAAAAGLLAALPADGLAYSNLDRAYGSAELGVSPRSRAMGGAGTALANGAYSLVDNPGALVLQAKTQVQLQAFAARASENRFVPIFDTFDSFVDENAVAVNDNGYASAQGGFVLKEWGERGVVLSAGVFNRYDPRYDYFDELRSTDFNNLDVIVSNRILETEGVLRAVSAGAAVPVGERIGLGAAVNYYFGEITATDAVIDHQGSGSSNSQLSRNLDGVSVTLGATAMINERVTAGLSVETSPQLSDDYTERLDGAVISPEESSGDLDLPVRVQGGVAYHPRNALRTTFAADVVFTEWSKIRDHLTPDLNLQDTWEARFGLEHVFYNGLPGRIGFRYGESYAMNEADQATFTFGFGYLVDRIGVDVAGEVGKRVSRQDPIRPRRSNFYREGAGRDRVEDTLVRVSLGVDYTF